MFMKDDKNKKAATVIISKMRKPESEMPPAPEMEPEMEDIDYVVDEIMDAIMKKDRAMLKEALKSFMEMVDD